MVMIDMNTSANRTQFHTPIPDARDAKVKNMPSRFKAVHQAEEGEEEMPDDKAGWKKQRVIHGALGVHVDDLIGGGNQRFEKAMQWLRIRMILQPPLKIERMSSPQHPPPL